MNDKHWEVLPDKTTEYWLQVQDPPAEDGHHWWTAHAKWDGCCEIQRYFNAPMGLGRDEDMDHIHICDLDEFIAKLVDLREKAREHFAGRHDAWE